MDMMGHAASLAAEDSAAAQQYLLQTPAQLIVSDLAERLKNTPKADKVLSAILAGSIAGIGAQTPAELTQLRELIRHIPDAKLRETATFSVDTAYASLAHALSACEQQMNKEQFFAALCQDLQAVPAATPQEIWNQLFQSAQTEQLLKQMGITQDSFAEFQAFIPTFDPKKAEQQIVNAILARLKTA
jgi:hypothetical protein